jgi:hypothetical protein
MAARMKPILTVALFSTLFATACSKEPATPTPPANPPANAPANTPAKDLGNVPAAPNQTPPVAQAPAVPEKPVTNEAPVAPTPTPAAPVAAPSLADLPKLLASIKDGASANAAKAPLEALVSKLQTAKDSAAPASGGNATGALSGLSKIASDAAGKLGISEDVQKQIGALLEKPEVKAALGATLEKLKGLLK